MFKKEKFSVPLFVTSSIIALFLLVGFYYFAIFPIGGQNLFFDDAAVGGVRPDKIYLNEDFKDVDDPFLTKNPDLKDMLDGPIISKNDPTLGNANAPVSLVVFSDFECNVCHKQEEVFGKIVNKYKDKVKFIWKDYPDKNENSLSFQASLAGRCANEQAGFWDYHNMLFENNGSLSVDKFVEIAEKAKLNVVRFENCLKEKKYKQQIIDNLLEANALEISGVPFIYVNDQEIMGEISYDDLGEIIEKELNND